jgi:hypothetical protein
MTSYHHYTMLDGCTMTVIDMTAYKRHKRYGRFLQRIQPALAFVYRWWVAFKEAVAVLILAAFIAAMFLATFFDLPNPLAQRYV